MTVNAQLVQVVMAGRAPIDLNEFLENARPFPGENRFVLGTFERGVTVYRQQIRALNHICLR
jgi:hypothetical protein